MKPPAFKFVEQSEQGMSALQNNIRDALAALLADDSVVYTVAKGISFTAGAIIAIPHKLGKQPSAWVITDAAGPGYPVLKRNAWDATTITLESQTTCVVDVRVW